MEKSEKVLWDKCFESMSEDEYCSTTLGKLNDIFKEYLIDKADAYDRLMTNGLLMKELANILKHPVAIDIKNRLRWFPKKPEIGYTTWIWYDNQIRCFGEGLPNGLISYTGSWQDSLTLPDGWEANHA